MAFNPNTDKVDMIDLTPSLQKKINESAEIVAYDLRRHTSNNVVHITSEERTKWNAKAPNDSPSLTGTPRSVTPPIGDNTTKIATTAFVQTTVNTHIPEVARTANKLANAVNVQLTGKARSTKTTFNGLQDILIPVTEIMTDSLVGTIDIENLAGTYDISISGTSRYAENAKTLDGTPLSAVVLKDSPTLTGIPKAPTAKVNTRTTQLATTEFIQNQLDYSLPLADVRSAEKLTNPFKFKTTGRLTAGTLTITGNSDVTYNVTDVDIADKLVGLDAATVNGHTVNSDVPDNAVFTDTVYTHPHTPKDLTGTEYMYTTVDRDGHVIAGSNPQTINVNISKNAATATKLIQARHILLEGVTATPGDFDGSKDTTIRITSIPANLIATDETHQFLNQADKNRLNGLPTTDEIDAKINALRTEIDWKETVATENEIKQVYPRPQVGWTVNVSENDTTYRWNGTEWVAISANAVPLASSAVDGKMSKEDKVKLDGIEANANNYVLPETLPATMITEVTDKKFMTDAEKVKLANLYNKTELDNLFQTKASADEEKPAKVGGSWTIDANDNGGLSFKFNNVEKAELKTDGVFNIITVNETGGLNGQTTADLIGDLSTKVAALDEKTTNKSYDGMSNLPEPRQLGDITAIRTAPNANTYNYYIGGYGDDGVTLKWIPIQIDPLNIKEIQDTISSLQDFNKTITEFHDATNSEDTWAANKEEYKYFFEYMLDITRQPMYPIPARDITEENGNYNNMRSMLLYFRENKPTKLGQHLVISFKYDNNTIYYANYKAVQLSQNQFEWGGGVYSR